VAADGALLVSDTGNNRLRRIDPATGVITAFAEVGTPDGMDVAADGSVYVVGGQDRRVVHVSASGARIGFVGPALALPYDVEAAGDGAVYVLEAGPVGYVRRIAPDGTMTTVSRQ
jgi:glucose/arabinose dehydrogenase